MKRFIAIVVLAFAATGAYAQASQKSAADCGVEPLSKYIDLSFRQFDQTMDGGWRVIGNKEGCETAAADLIAQYHERLRRDVDGLDWHEGQLRAAAGQSARAIELFKRILASDKSEPPEHRSDANILYHEATIAFLEGDRKTLEAKRAELAVLPMPDGMAEGLAKFKERYPGQPAPEWPLNLGVVDGLIRCFGKPYGEAYACRGGNTTSAPSVP
jgi:hypothetical protein